MTTTTTSDDDDELTREATLPDESPISNYSLELVAQRVSRRYKAARKALSRSEQRRVRTALGSVYEVANSSHSGDAWPVRRRIRLELSKELEELAFMLLGSTPFVPDFYADGRLAIVRAWEPVRIRESIDPAWVEQHFTRYEQRAERALRRLNWFLERCGVEPDKDEDEESAPWNQPYQKIDNYRELLWGTPRPRRRRR